MNIRKMKKGVFLYELRRAGAWPPVDSPNLYDRTGNLAIAHGVWHPRIVADRLYEGAPSYVQSFLLYHEGAHILCRHPVKDLVAGGLVVVSAFLMGWLLVGVLVGALCAVLCRFAMWLFLRLLFESEADRFALELLRPKEFINAVHQVYRPSKNPVTRLLDTIIHGKTWKERCERAGVRFETEEERCAPVAS